MSNRTLAAVVVVFIAAAVYEERRAEACHGGDEMAIGLGVLATDALSLPFALHDLVVRHSSLTYARAEILVMGAATVINLGLLAKSFGNCAEDSEQPGYPVTDSGTKTFVAVSALWSLALTIHGIYELATERRTPVTPTVVSDGEHVGAGVAWIGRF